MTILWSGGTEVTVHGSPNPITGQETDTQLGLVTSIEMVHLWPLGLAKEESFRRGTLILMEYRYGSRRVLGRTLAGSTAAREVRR